MVATRFCMTCGTEVDEEATFCPACGNPMDAPPVNEIPAAPAWPRPEPEPIELASAGVTPADAPTPDVDSPTADADAPMAHADALAGAYANEDAGADVTDAAPKGGTDEALPERAPFDDQRFTVEPEPSGPPQAAVAPRPPAAVPPPPSARPGPAGSSPAGDRPISGGGHPRGSQLDLPITWPVTLSGWLIGIGSLVGALAVLLDFRAFTNPVTLIAFLLLLAVAAVVFFSASVPAIPHRELWIMVVVLVGFGAALERVGGGTAFAGVIFFLATGAAAAGAIIVELGLDRPFGGGTSG
jgi:hypothetical protein